MVGQCHPRWPRGKGGSDLSSPRCDERSPKPGAKAKASHNGATAGHRSVPASQYALQFRSKASMPKEGSSARGACPVRRIALPQLEPPCHNPKYRSLGNQMDLTMGDYLDSWRRSGSACHRGLCRRVKRSMAAKTARSLQPHHRVGRSVIFERAGMEPAGAGAAASHTELAGDYRSPPAVSQGELFCDSLDEFVMRSHYLLCSRGRKARAIASRRSRMRASKCRDADTLEAWCSRRLARRQRPSLRKSSAARITEIVDIHNPRLIQWRAT